MLQPIRSAQAHELYHEAQRRAQQPQPVVKHRRAKSLLLPAPNNIIFELFNTIIKEIPKERLTEFIIHNLREYLYSNWSNKILHRIIRRLKREQAIDVRAGLTNAPVIKFSTGVHTSRAPTTVVDVHRSPTSPKNAQSPPTANPQAGTQAASQPASALEQPLSPTNSHTSLQFQRPQIQLTKGVRAVPGSPVDPEMIRRRQVAADQVYEHIMWRIQSENVTQAASLLIKLALDDGYKSGKLKSEPYEDVLSCFENWRGQKLIKLYAFGVAPVNDQKLVLASTLAGDLTKWIANYIDGSEKRQKPEQIRLVATALRDRTKNCIFITNELIDAIRSIESDAVRCAFLVDRLNRYEPITSMPNFSSQIEPMIQNGKLFVMNNLSCVEFAPDPSADTCC